MKGKAGFCASRFFELAKIIKEANAVAVALSLIENNFIIRLGYQ